MVFFRNTSYSLLGKLVGVIFLVLLDALIARLLEIEAYAEWVYFYSILSILFYVGWLGINMSTKVRVSQSKEADEKALFLACGWLLRLGGSLLISMLLAFLMAHICTLLGYPDKYPHLQSLFLCGSLLIFFNSFTEYYKEALMGLSCFRHLFFITVLEYGGYFLFAALALSVCPSVYGVAAGYACAGLVVFLAGFLLIGHRVSSLRHFPTARCRQVAEELAKSAIPFFFVGIGVVVLIEIDVFMIGMLSTKEEVAIYNIAKSLNAKAAHVNYSIAVGAMTAFACVSPAAAGEAKKLFDRVSRTNLLATAAISVCMIVLAPVFIDFLYGSSYLGAQNAVRMLVPYYILYSLSMFYSTFLDFRGKAKVRSWGYVSIIVLDIAINYLLIPKYGAMGAALATCISLVPYTLLVIAVTKMEWKRITRKGA